MFFYCIAHILQVRFSLLLYNLIRYLLNVLPSPRLSSSREIQACP